MMMSRKAPPPPSSAAPISQETVEIVRRKMAPPPPAAPPPDAMLAAFKVPLTIKTNPTNTNSNNNYNNNSIPSNAATPGGGAADSKESNRHSSSPLGSPSRGSVSYSDDEEDFDNRGSSGSRNGNSSRFNNDNRGGVGSRVAGPRIDDDSLDDRRRPAGRDRDREDMPTNSSIEDSVKANGKYTGVSSSKAESKSDKGKKIVMQASAQGFLDYSPILSFTYRDLKLFINTPCEKGVTARCYIERNKSGSNWGAPMYSLCADLEDGTGREIMVCKKIMASMSAHYVFSLKEDDLHRKREQRSKLYLGKLRGTGGLIGGSDEYILYDSGNFSLPPGIYKSDKSSSKDNDEDAAESSSVKEIEGLSDNSLYRKEIMATFYNTKKRPNPTPDKIRASEVCISNPAFDESSAILAVPFAKIREDGTQNSVKTQPYLIIHERTSRYDPLSSCLVDFKGRGSTPSVKNAQYVESTPMSDQQASRAKEGDKWVLQVAKFTPDCFNMDFRYPLTMFQAFAICISRFDADLSW